MLLHCLFTCIVSDRKSAVIFIFLNVMTFCVCVCPLAAFEIFSLSLVLSDFTMMCLGVIFFMCFCVGPVKLLRPVGFSFHQVWEIIISSNIFFCPMTLSDNPVYMNIKPLEVVPQLTDAFLRI